MIGYRIFGTVSHGKPFVGIIGPGHGETRFFHECSLANGMFHFMPGIAMIVTRSVPKARLTVPRYHQEVALIKLRDLVFERGPGRRTTSYDAIRL